MPQQVVPSTVYTIHIKERIYRNVKDLATHVVEARHKYSESSVVNRFVYCIAQTAAACLALMH